MSTRATTCEYYIGLDSNFRSNMFFQTLHGLHTSLVKYLTSCDKLYQWHCRSATNFDCSIGSTAAFQLSCFQVGSCGMTGDALVASCLAHMTTRKSLNTWGRTPIAIDSSNKRAAQLIERSRLHARHEDNLAGRRRHRLTLQR